MTTNKINNKRYIGKHQNFNDEYYGSSKQLKEDIKKYGKQNFIREILVIASSYEELNQLEIEYIAKYNAVSDPMFYNIHIGGCGGNTRAGYTEEENKRYSEKMRQISLNNNYLRVGIPRSNIEKMHISQGCKKRWQKISNEDLQKFRDIMHNAVLGTKNPNYNNKWTNEQRQKLSDYFQSINHSKGIKNPNYGNTGDKAKNGKAIYMYDLNFNLIKKFNTKQQVLNFLNLKGHTQLNMAIKYQRLFKGYYWSLFLLNV